MPALSKLHTYISLFALILVSVVYADTAIITEIPDENTAVEAGILNLSDNFNKSKEFTTDLARHRQSVEEYEKVIQELQKSHGVYYEPIGEELIGLGLAYKNLGQYKEALQALNRSLYINRINHGLHNPNQVPLLELVIEINTALGDWEALDRNYHYLYWVNRRTYGENDPRLLPVIDRLGLWNLNAYSLESNPIPFKHLLTADSLFHDAVKIIETNYGQYDPRLINPLYGIAMTNYRIASHASSSMDFDEIRTSTRSLYRMERMLEEQEARQELISDSYRTGKKAILRITDIYANNPELPPDAHGIALIHLGDWYLLFNRRMTAGETYEIAYAKLKESGMQPEDIDSLFSTPRSLPALRPPIEHREEEDNSPYVIARFDVSKNGQARNIEIIESNLPENKLLIRQAKRTIAATRFRPKIEDGQPVATAGVNIKYVIHE